MFTISKHFHVKVITQGLFCRHNRNEEGVVVVIKNRSGRSDPVGVLLYIVNLYFPKFWLVFGGHVFSSYN